MKRLAANAPDAPIKFWQTIHGGGLVVYPTDTLYGLGADSTNPAAIRRLQLAKGREGPFSVLVGSLESLQDFALVSPAIAGKLVEMLPGPFTIVLRPAPDLQLHPALIGPGGKIGFRVSSHPFLQGVFSRDSEPVISTSVNQPGQPPLQVPDLIESGFGSSIDLLLDAGTLPPSGGSTVVDVTRDPWKVLRQGDGKV
ncbi:MAG: L-threonylcarbamoyladenylate synthase [Candidatus Neomarinimicrobiota bacterium]